MRACQDMGVLRKEDAKLQLIAIVSAIHGFLSLLNDGRIAHLLTDRYSVEQAQEFVIVAIIRGVGEPQD